MKRLCTAALRGTGRLCLGATALAVRTTLVLAVLSAISIGALLAPQYLPVPPAYAQWAQGVLYAISTVTGEREPLKSTDGSLRTYIVEMPNPSCHNTALGICESGSGGSAYFDDNAATGSYQITTGPSRLVRYEIGGSTTATVTFYDDGDGTCSSNQRTPTRTAPSATIPGIYENGMDFDNGICMLVGGAADAEIGVVTLP